jgi:hypothetical protein
MTVALAPSAKGLMRLPYVSCTVDRQGDYVASGDILGPTENKVYKIEATFSRGQYEQGSASTYYDPTDPNSDGHHGSPPTFGFSIVDPIGVVGTYFGVGEATSCRISATTNYHQPGFFSP